MADLKVCISHWVSGQSIPCLGRQSPRICHIGGARAEQRFCVWVCVYAAGLLDSGAVAMTCGRGSSLTRAPEFDSSHRFLTPVFNEINHLAAVF